MSGVQRSDDEGRNTEGADDLGLADLPLELKRTMDRVDENVIKVNKKVEEIDKLVAETRRLTRRGRDIFDRWEREKQLRSGGRYEREL